LVGSDGNCLDSDKEYKSDDSNLCCKKCHPGYRLKQTCSENTETICEPCPADQYMEKMNYYDKCFSCNKCKSAKGLQYVQNCSSRIKSKCGCKPGMYCIMGFDGLHCEACTMYKPCKAGYGVSLAGTANSDVKCKICPDGTFSNKVSYTDPCWPHTNCHGKVVREGNATTDNVCHPEAFTSNKPRLTSTKEPYTETTFTTMSTVTSTASDPKVPGGSTDFKLPRNASEAVFNHSTKSLSPNTASDNTLGMEANIVFPLNMDANGNCETATKLMSLTVTSLEQQSLLEKSETCSDQSKSSNDTLIRTEVCSSYESIHALQSTTTLHSQQSALSEPMSLLSNTDPVPSQTSMSTQSSSQPTSPQIITPLTTTPHVNVNITFHIGNGSGRTPSVMSTDLVQDSQLPFGEEEESFSMPQQEAGKQSVMAVQESGSMREDLSA
uniref:TNFR-Cys domain-containing protein n=1 Tax=Mola mola TaxID=94237 RepID=A0A3Q3WH63_MOLML